MVLLAYSPRAHLVPIDWSRQMLVRMHLVDREGNCRYCKARLVKIGQPFPFGPTAETKEQLEAEMRAAIEHLTRERHGGQDPMHSCSRCGALDYRIMRAMVVKAASDAQQAVLLLPLQCSPGGVMYDLHLGDGAQRFNTLAPRDKQLGTTKCVLCNEETHAQSRSTNTGVHYSVQHSVCGDKITMSIGPADDAPGCEMCGQLGTPAAPLKACGACNVFYCSPECSIADWPRHKLNCTVTKKKGTGSGSEEAKCAGGGSITMDIGAADSEGCLVCGILGTPAAPLKRCGACRGPMYCSKDCQQKNWPMHKKGCKPKGAASEGVSGSEEASGSGTTGP